MKPAEQMWQEALAAARLLAAEAHCRYCDRIQDDRLRCITDIELDARNRARALLTARIEGLREVLDLLASYRLRYDSATPGGNEQPSFKELLSERAADYERARRRRASDLHLWAPTRRARR